MPLGCYANQNVPLRYPIVVLDIFHLDFTDGRMFTGRCLLIVLRDSELMLFVNYENIMPLNTTSIIARVRTCFIWTFWSARRDI